MARTVRDARLDTRNARLALKPRHEPYWRTIEQGMHLGYRKGIRGGVWRGRVYLEGIYRKTALGTADDILDADGVEVLSFAQAQDKARKWFAEQARQAADLEPVPAGPYTVADAIRDYLAQLEARGARGTAQARHAANAHILPSLGNILAAKLTTKRIRDWHHGLAAEAARLRSKRHGPINYRAAPQDREGKRKRQATANRILIVLRAALNHAYREGRVPHDDAWRRIKPFRDVSAPVMRYLSEAECKRLVNASASNFRPLVRAALLTGCRYGELTALVASDFNSDSGTLAIRASKSGKSRHVTLTEEGQRFFAELTAGKARGDLIFSRDGAAWGRSYQQRPLVEACKRAKISPHVSFHVLRHTHGSLLAMRGVPMSVIARQLGHADTRMTERHYAHLAPSYVTDTIRANFPALGIVPPSKVTPLRARDRKSAPGGTGQ